MILCNEDYIPCCNFCIHKINGNLEVDGTDGPIGCKLHEDKEHQEIAEWCGYCDDFHCFRANN